MARTGISTRPMRRLVTIGTPAALIVVSLFHPSRLISQFGPTVFEFLRPQVFVWLAVHVVQLFLIGPLGLTVWYLTERLEGRFARTSRAALVPFLVFYSALDSIVGIGTGMLVWQSLDFTGQQRAVAEQVIQRFYDSQFDPFPGLVILIGAIAWIVVCTGAGVALWKAGESRWMVVLMVLAGVLFGLYHPFPTGTMGMLCLLATVIMRERHLRTAGS